VNVETNVDDLVTIRLLSEEGVQYKEVVYLGQRDTSNVQK